MGEKGRIPAILGLGFFAAFGTMLEEVYVRRLMIHRTGSDQCEVGDPCPTGKRASLPGAFVVLR
jgi:hypothetical protein